MADAEEVSESMQDLSLICPNDIVFFDPGEDAVLSCHLKPAISAVSMEIKWWNKEDPVCHYKNGQTIKDYEGQASLPLHDLYNGNVSLTLKAVRRSQAGHYVCEVIHECRTLKENIFLHISSIDFCLVVPAKTISADPGEDVILPAHLSPETSAVSMDIRWCRGTELIYRYNNGQEIRNNDYEIRVSVSSQELRRGNLALSLRNVQQSDSGEYTCKVFYDGCQKRGVVHLQVREIERNDDSQRVNHLRSVLQQVYDNIMNQKLKLLTDTMKLIEETLDNDDKNEKRSTSTRVGPSSKRTNSMEGIPPFCPTHRSTSSMEGIPPHLEGEHGSQNTVLAREENTDAEQELSSQIVQRLLTERATQTQQSPGATMEMTAEMRPESTATEQDRFFPTLQSERGRTSQSITARDTQTSERPENRAQRTQENTGRSCQIV